MSETSTTKQAKQANRARPPRVAAPVLPYRPRDPKRYRPGIGLIGCGGITKWHLTAYKNAEYNVVALCDVDLDRAKLRRDEFYPQAAAFDSYQQLLARDDIEVVDITTHPPQRPPIVEAALRVNESQKDSILDRIRRLVPQLEGKTIGILGLAFKPETDDIREAPSVRIITDLVKAGAKVRAYDPAAMESAGRLLTDVQYCDDEYDAARGSDALVVVTEWNQFRRLDMDRLKQVMQQIDPNFPEAMMVQSARQQHQARGRLA